MVLSNLDFKIAVINELEELKGNENFNSLKIYSFNSGLDTAEKRISEPGDREEKHPGWNTESRGWKTQKTA